MIKYATCNIVISPTVTAKSTRKKIAEVNMEIVTSQTVNAPKPINLVIKSEHFARIIELLTAFGKPDEELNKVLQDSILASEVEGKTVEETAAWARKNIVAELEDMS